MAKSVGEYGYLLGRLRALDAVFGPRTTTLLHASGVESASDNVVSYTRQILHAATTNENDGMLLEIMTFVRNIGDDLAAVRETDLCHLTDSGVRLLRGARHDLHAHAAAKWVSIQSRRFRLCDYLAPAFAHELVDCRHTK